ncbi:MULTISPECIES: galactokinase [unclassified Arthrobacter]|uniref:galactokinase n=1 Tax=unclassified Arthrobacter TaxID=235627 RepID=UPI001E6221D9|nr:MULTISPECIES: galactokinase [unclassified Arthrobacter]MCC9146800.1 galactokinase [Arthrobacter sp. zg-Y919]MDK1278032.1 galactokinase [Arthrobacter sp. zg.Y919]WIB03378.1 galactokinase [Arthrobacter sp. zg-Y919]
MNPTTLAAAFTERFGAEPDGLWSAPGRVNVIGEHTDYNDGFVLPFALEHSTTAAAAVRRDRMVRVASTLTPDDEPVTADLDLLTEGSVEGWAAYPLGVLWAMEQSGYRCPGMDLLIDSSVPVGAGLSSSAALECAVAVAANDLSQAQVSRRELAAIGQLAENRMVGAPTGIMDQSASLLGEAGHALFLDCRSGESRLVPLDLEGAGLELMVIDTRVSHAHSTGGYAARRRSCERGAELMGVAALRDVSVGDLERAAGVMDEETFRRVRHVVTENARVEAAVEVLTGSGPAGLGPLLVASHTSMRNDFEISCPELDAAVDAALAAGALGARMTGGGFGGSAIALARAGDVPAIRSAVEQAFSNAGFRSPVIFSVLPGTGAGPTA